MTREGVEMRVMREGVGVMREGMEESGHGREGG